MSQGKGRGVNGNYEVPKTVCEYFYFTVETFFLQYLNFWNSHGQGWGVNGNYAVARIVCEHFYFYVLNVFFNIPISENGTVKAEVSAATTRFPKQFANFYFPVETFFQYFGFWTSHGQGRGVNGNYAVPTYVWEHFYFSVEIFFLSILISVGR